MSLEKLVRRASPVALSLLLAACDGTGVSFENLNQEAEPEAGAAVGVAIGPDNSTSENPASAVAGSVGNSNQEAEAESEAGAAIGVAEGTDNSTSENPASAVAGSVGNSNQEAEAESEAGVAIGVAEGTDNASSENPASSGSGSNGNSNQEAEPETGAAIGEAEGTGNSTSESPASTISGRVADGYIQGAIVCVDLNDNDSCDTDEPSTVTSDGGTYDLEIPAGAEKKSIVADIPAEAIDEDTGEAVGKPLVFIAPAEKPEFLSPITTLIHQEMRANPALEIGDAEQSVKSILGIDEEDVSLFSDYVAEGKDASGNSEKAEKFRFLHDTARVVASLMKDIETQVQTAAVSSGIDVVGSADTQRAIREIVRSEVRELLPEIARQVAQIAGTDDPTVQGSAEVDTDFNPNQLAQNLRPSDAGESVQERIDAVRDRVEVVQSDMRQLLTDGVYWMELDCHDDVGTEGSIPVEGEPEADDYDDDISAGIRNSGDVDHAMPECEARYGQARLSSSGDSLVSDNYLFDGESDGWVVDVDEDDEDDFHMADYSLVDGQWVLVQSDGPEGQVEFTEDGVAVITNDAGQMQLKAVTQEVGATKVINHFWQDGADPIWLGLVDHSSMFPADSLAHKISVRQSSHPFKLFNHQSQDDQSREFCAQFNGNCNVVNALMDGQHIAVVSLDEIRDSAALGFDLVVHSSGFDNDGLIKLSAELPVDGTLPTKGIVHWDMDQDGNDYGPGEISLVGIESGVDGVGAYGTYPAGQDVLHECSEGSYSGGSSFPDQQAVELPADGQISGISLPAERADIHSGDNGQDSDDSSNYFTPEEAEQFPEFTDSEHQEGSGLPEKTVCADLIAQTGSVSVINDYREVLSTGAEESPESVYEHGRMLASEWKLIEIDGVSMIEIQLPFILRHDAEDDRGDAMLLVEHDGFVRLGARLPESFTDRVITYNETAFTTLRAIVESVITSKQ